MQLPPSFAFEPRPASSFVSRVAADPPTSVLAKQIQQLAADRDVWCIFDNTASGAELENAWELQQLLGARAYISADAPAEFDRHPRKTPHR